jgi:hypothetical protein
MQSVIRVGEELACVSWHKWSITASAGTWNQVKAFPESERGRGEFDMLPKVKSQAAVTDLVLRQIAREPG